MCGHWAARFPPEEEGRAVWWAGWMVRGCLERDEGRQGNVQGISAPCLGMHGSWTETASLGIERPARGRLYSILERRKRCLRGGEAAFQHWRKFSHPEPRQGEAEGRQGERVGEEAEMHLNNPGKTPPALLHTAEMQRGQRLPAARVWGTVSKS